MSASDWIRDAHDHDFEREVLERSQHTPVVVDFWAPWCGPCRALGPLLERLAEEHAGAFVLVRVDIDQSPGVAARYGVRSIPAVLGMRDGTIVAEFVGAQPEPMVRKFLEAVLPSEADRLAAEAQALLDAGDSAAADSTFRAALAQEARHGRALLGLARLVGTRGDAQEGLDLLERVVPTHAIAEEAERLAAELRTRVGAEDVDEAALRRRIEENPGALGSRLALGRALAAGQRYEEALEMLLEVVKRNPHHADDAARKAMLDVFAVLGSDHELTKRFRGELAHALYR